MSLVEKIVNFITKCNDMEETFARYETLNKLRKPDTTQINNVLDRLEKM